MWVIPVVLTVIILWLVYPEWKARRIFPTIQGPHVFPLLGTLPHVLWANFRGVRLNEDTLNLFHKHGPVIRGKLGGRYMILTGEPEDVKYFLQTNFTNYIKSPSGREMMYDIFGDGIFNTNGDQWHVQRQTASSLFHFNNLHDFVQVFKERANVMCSVLEQQAESGPVEMQDLFMRYTLDSIGELGFGTKIGSLTGNEKAMAFAQGFDYVQEATAKRSFTHPLWKYFPHKEFDAHLQHVDDFMKGVIEERREEIRKGIDVSSRVDLLSRFITEKNEDGTVKFDNKYLLDVLKNFLIAGRDTTAVCLTWAIYLISQHPDVEKKLLQEINRVIGKAGEITYENQSELTYMKQVIDETLRLYPSVPRNARMAVNDDVLPSGHRIPAGTSIGYIPYAQHRLSQLFKDPLVFNPDRWVTDSIKPFSFVPFHGGPRICLGQNMAYQEIKVALATLLPRFSFRLAEKGEVTYRITITLATEHGLKMWVEKRG